MLCLGFKGGSGTASRIATIDGKQYTLGAFVQSNFGRKKNLTIAGVPVGQELKDTLNYEIHDLANSHHQEGDGSIIVVIATDAPLLPHQLKRIAERVALGVGRVGGRGENSSGDIFIVFSTANPHAFSNTDNENVTTIPNEHINALFTATIEATEEAIVNALFAGKTLTGINGNTVFGMPKEAVLRILKQYNRLDN